MNFSFGSIATFVVGAALAVVGAWTGQGYLTTMGVSMMASSVISAVTAPPPPSNGNVAQLNTSTNIQVPPATKNKLPLVYGYAFVGGVITDLSISGDNQDLYYVLSICEITNNGTDTVTFGNVFYGGKRCVFGTGADSTKVVGLIDPSTGIEDTSCNGYLNIYLYSNGSYSPANSTQSAISVMQASGLTYQWDNNKLMTNAAFAIVHLKYNQNANTTSLQSTQFQVTNPRSNTGDVIYDYLTSPVYGAGIPSDQIDTASLSALTTYCNQIITFYTWDGVPQTAERFNFNGAVDLTQPVLSNLQNMVSCCDCLLKYNEVTGKWGVIVQSPDYFVAMDINDTNTTSAISINSMDISNIYNIAECQFADAALNGAFNTSTINLAEVDPAIMYSNEPINSQTIKLPLVNVDRQAQLLATRFLKAARLDLQIQLSINFIGLELEAGDVVTVTNANYGWVAKLFRVFKVNQNFNPDGSITVTLNLQEYDPEVYDDVPIYSYRPPSNTGLSAPNFFGTLTPPYIASSQPTATNPSFQVNVNTSSNGVAQYVEIWYSAYSSPSSSQLIFAGTSQVQPNGNPYPNNSPIPAVTLNNIPSGDWYFFARMVNSISTSIYSPASTVFKWRPTTFQYTDRYLSVAYADDLVGTGFSLSPRSKGYYGLANQANSVPSTTPSDYTWYQANVNFGSAEYLLYTNRTGRKFSFSEGFAAYAAGTASFVPTQTLVFDPSIWAALPDGTNTIDLDARTGQLIQTGTTTVGTGQIAITNNTDGNIIASLQEYLDFGGPYTKTSSVATLTIDIYGRVVGFETPDDFYYTESVFTATSGQTVFTVTRAAGYISGQCLVFENGLLLNTSEYTDTGGSTGTVTFGTGRTAGDIITIISFKSVNSSTGVYSSFTRNSVSLSNQATYTASGFSFNDGFELLFLNGTVVNAQDYNLSGQVLSLINNTTGDLEVIQWTPNNLGVANGTPTNVDAFTVVGQTIYPFNYNINAFNLYNNGTLQKQTVDYTTGSGTYTLTTAPLFNTNILVQQTFARTGAV